MTGFFTLWRKELAGYFLSPIAYVVTIFFLVIMGFSFWMLASVLVQGPLGGSVIQELFGSIFFWLAMLIVVPIITMRLFAEEKKTGTIEILLTAPITEVAVVMAKYMGALVFFLLMWVPTLAYAYILHAFSPLTAPVDLGPMLGGYLGAFLVGAFYLSIGVVCSSLTSNQIVSAISCFAAIVLAFFSGFLPYVSRLETVEEIARFSSSVAHMLDFSRGAIDTRPVVFYLSLTGFMLFLSVVTIKSRRWK